MELELKKFRNKTSQRLNELENQINKKYKIEVN